MRPLLMPFVLLFAGAGELQGEALENETGTA